MFFLRFIVLLLTVLATLVGCFMFVGWGIQDHLHPLQNWHGSGPLSWFFSGLMISLLGCAAGLIMYGLYAAIFVLYLWVGGDRRTAS